MRIKKMLKMLEEAIKNHSSDYTEEELEYMQQQLQVIKGELKKIQHKDYKGFAKK